MSQGPPTGGRSDLVTATSRLLAEATRVYSGGLDEPILRAAAARLGEPLRVAIAGRVKAGKSTLLNALVGQELAATDAGECTTLVTWYADGVGYRVDLHPVGEAPHQLPFRQKQGRLDIDLEGVPPEDVERLVVTWPSPALRRTTLIDTPGVGSVNTEVSARSERILAPESGAMTEADAVVYLMRHAHGDDLGFLEAFRDGSLDRRTVSTIAVLSRADEIGHGRPDALDTAQRIADRYRVDPRVRALCQTVVPLAGLLASSAASLREPEYRALTAIAAAPETDDMLMTATRFATVGAGPVEPVTRADLLDRYGMFGVRLAVRLIRENQVNSARALAQELTRASGMDQLRELLDVQFGARSDVLKARSALAVLDDVVRRAPIEAAESLVRELERIRAGAHEFAEIALIDDLRNRRVLLPSTERDEAERLLGGDGMRATERLGLRSEAADTEIHEVASEQHLRWQRRAENPGVTRERAQVARVLVRTCEGLIAGTAGTSPGRLETTR